MSTEAAVAPASSDQPALGRGMVHRARRQTVLAQHWSAAGVVGAVGRASVGFGLAIGRSRAIRPTVSYADLNSTALRPSIEGWRAMQLHHARGDDGVPAPLGSGPAGDTRPPARGPATGPTDQPARSTHREPPSSPAARGTGRDRPARHRPSVPIRRQPESSARPTWTDQVIQRSGVGYTPPAAVAARTPSSLPDGFVPFGDPAIDRMRLAAMAKEGRLDVAPAGASDAASSTDVRRSTASGTGARRSTVAGEAGPLLHGDTTAGGSTAPGRLARALRPERVVPGDQAARSALAPTSRPSTPGGDDRAVASSGAPGHAVPDRAARVNRGAPAGDKLHDLRAALEAQGFFGDNPATPDATAPPDAARETRPAGRPDSDGPTNPAARTEPARTERPRRDRPPGQEPTRRTDTSNVVRRAATDAAGRVGTAEVTRRPADGSSTSPAAGRSSPSPGDFAVRGDGSVRGDRAQLRMSRLLANDGRPRTVPVPGVGLLDRAAPAAIDNGNGVATDRAGALPGVVTPAPVELDASRRPPDAASPPVAPPAAPLIARRRTPTLPTALPVAARRPTSDLGQARSMSTSPFEVSSSSGTGASARAGTAGTALRRVSLPRTMSRTHRPAGNRSAADGMWPSTVTQQTLDVERNAAATALPPGIAMPGDTTARSATVMRSATLMRSDIAIGSGALLDVIRRRPVRPTVTPTGASGPADTAGTAAVSSPSGSAREASSRAIARQGTAPATQSLVAHSSSAGHAPAAAAAPEQAPAEALAERFMTELSRSVRNRPTPLPTSYRPLADAIAGPRPVMLSTDTASRRALRSVGKVAATTGDTIHLDRSAVSQSRLNEVMAHELTHIAAPSPAPRFFDDIDDSPEERRAERVGRIMASSPVAPAASLAALNDTTIRRSPARSSLDESGSADGPGVLSADAMITRLRGTGSAPSGSAPIIRRLHGRSSSPPKMGSHRQRGTNAQPNVAPPPRQDAPPAGQDAPAPSSVPAPEPSPPAQSAPPAVGYELDADKRAPDWFRSQLDANLDRLLHLIEDRMIVELERRGGRTWRSP